MTHRTRIIPLLALASVFSLAAQAPAAILAGYWTFDDGTANDSSGNGNNGSFVSGSSTAAVAPVELGGQSLLLEGSGERVEVSHSASLAINDTITISLWMKADVSAQTTNFIKPITKNPGATTSPGWELQQDGTNDQVEFRIDTTGQGNQIKSNVNGVWDDEWHHLAFVLDKGNITSYLDGSLWAAETYNHGTGFNTTNILIFGSTNGGGRSLVGYLDEIAIYHGALGGKLIGDLADGVAATHVPQPASLSLLAVAGAALLRRRRR